MPSTHRRCLVVGGGAFGLAAALVLSRRGWTVRLLDPGPIPHPSASSTDTSKAARMDYGSDAFYADLAAEALDGWRAWNRAWNRPVFHETGILFLTRGPMRPESFEGRSFVLLSGRGVPVERLDRASLTARFPAWASANYDDGYFNPCAGWVESALAVKQLADEARAAGVELVEGASVRALHEERGRFAGVVLDGGTLERAETLLIAAGAWTPVLVPWLASVMTAVAQPVVHFQAADPRAFEGQRFPVWCAEIQRTGWYGFPATAAGAVKIGHHGPGRHWQPGMPLEVTHEEVLRAREFAAATFPGLAGASIAATRACLYCDTFDGDFFIDRDPAHPELVVAAGGSGHGFKFAPVLGALIADVIEGRPNPRRHRFAWRAAGPRAAEEARFVAG